MLGVCRWDKQLGRMVCGWDAQGGRKAAETLRAMAGVIDSEYIDPDLIDLATTLATQAAEKDDAGIAGQILAWLRDYTVFVKDPDGVELLRAPLVMLGTIDARGVAAGDCDDIAMLGAAMCLAVGLPVELWAEGYDPDPRAPALAHVFAVVNTPAGFLALDTQRGPDDTFHEPVHRVRFPL